MKIKDNDKKSKSLERYLKQLECKISVGLHEEQGSALHPEADGETIFDIAAANHFGVPSNNVPARPFVSHWFDTHINDISENINDIFTALINKQIKPNKTLEIYSQELLDSMKADITNKIYVPNKPSTLKRKQGDTPLIDSSVLFDSLKYKIQK